MSKTNSRRACTPTRDHGGITYTLVRDVLRTRQQLGTSIFSLLHPDCVIQWKHVPWVADMLRIWGCRIVGLSITEWLAVRLDTINMCGIVKKGQATIGWSQLHLPLAMWFGNHINMIERTILMLIYCRRNNMLQSEPATEYWIGSLTPRAWSHHHFWVCAHIVENCIKLGMSDVARNLGRPGTRWQQVYRRLYNQWTCNSQINNQSINELNVIQ